MIAVTTGFETRLVKNGTKTPKRNKTKMLSGEHSKKIKKTKKKPKPLLQKIKKVCDQKLYKGLHYKITEL